MFTLCVTPRTLKGANKNAARCCYLFYIKKGNEQKKVHPGALVVKKKYTRCFCGNKKVNTQSKPICTSASLLIGPARTVNHILAENPQSALHIGCSGWLSPLFRTKTANQR